MDSRMLFVLLWMLLFSTTSTGIKLDGNGYVDIVIAISTKVPQDDTLIGKIKDMVTEGSFYLHQALDKRIYFKEVTILVPPHWSNKDFTRARTESFEKAKIRIDHADSDEPYTKQYGECGEMGEYIHFTPNFLLNDSVIKSYGLRGKVFVHEWAHLRWGVYDEYNEETPFYLSEDQIEASRCNKNIEGQLYDLTPEGSLQPCRIDPHTSLPTSGCKFFPEKSQTTDSSIMFITALDSETKFCQENEHNYEAPNLQNKKCGKATWTVIFEDSVDKDALRSLEPMQSTPPEPTFKVVQRMKRVVCLILDVSGSMKQHSRILRLQQAATHLLLNVIEDQASVGIVAFSTEASILSSLAIIDSDDTRNNFIKLLPKKPQGWTSVCKGLILGLQVLQEDNGDVLGDEIIFLTDGQATDNITDCSETAINSGVIINTIALGPKADPALRKMSDKTGGKYLLSNDEFTSNQLMDAFASLTLSTGDYTKEPVQLESIGNRTSDWFNGTVTVDQTVGNKTSFIISYEQSLHNMYIYSPSGSIYTQSMRDESLKRVTFNVAGTAESGDWRYSIQTTIRQALTVTVTSQAARADVPPIIVKAHMSQQFSDGTKAMKVFADVSQNYRPVTAEVWAILESDSGSADTLQLLDNGAGADSSRNDGIYSRYFIGMKNGRSSLKLRVKNQYEQDIVVVPKNNRALYVPGFVMNGTVELNPPKPPVSGEPLKVGSFTRTVIGESFEVNLADTTPTNFPPNKITDLSAEIQEDTVHLIWTAPGEDLDQGAAKSYEIRWSFKLATLRFNFSSGHAVNTAAVSPKEFGRVEQHSFNLSSPIQNGTTLFFAIQSEDKQNAKSEISNIASASKILPGQTLISTATAESCQVTPMGKTTNLPPNRITDLDAEIQEDTVLLRWTAPGEDLDQGTVKFYNIRWSFDLEMLRESFSNGHSVNTSVISPQEAGSVEQHSFNLSFPIQNGTTLFLAVQSEDKQNAKSETSNIASASKILPGQTPVRTSTTESFEVTLTGTTSPNFPPNKITDLSSEIQEGTVQLIWTAPGVFKQAKAESYNIRWSFDLEMLQKIVSNLLFNTTAVSSQEAGSVEPHSFDLSFTIQIGTTLAIKSMNEPNVKSETSKTASASKIVPGQPPIKPKIPNPVLNLTVLFTSLCVVTMVLCFIVGAFAWAKRRRRGFYLF